MWRVGLIMVAMPAFADSVVATRTVRAQAILTTEDVTTVEMDIPGALTEIASVVGQETKVAIYAGRPIQMQDIGAPAVIERNQIVPLFYDADGLSIQTEGRALSRGGVGEMIEVMNLTSRTKVVGKIGTDGMVHVSPSS